MLPHLLQIKAVQKTVKDALVLEGFKRAVGCGEVWWFQSHNQDKCLTEYLLCPRLNPFLGEGN